MTNLKDTVVLITGASSGIGAACAGAFAAQGASLVLAARRLDRLEAMKPDLLDAGAVDVHVAGLDVRDQPAVQAMVDGLPERFRNINILVNNAGLSRGLDKLHEAELNDWEEMIDTNVKGLLYVDRAVVPGMVERESGTVVHIGSIAGTQVYPGGNVYCATKHAVRAISDGLRLDLLGTGVRVISIDPGLVDTEFGQVRYHGDTRKAKMIYIGMTPLAALDVADAVLFACTRPGRVQVAEMLLLPTDQAGAVHVHRRRG